MQPEFYKALVKSHFDRIKGESLASRLVDQRMLLSQALVRQSCLASFRISLPSACTLSGQLCFECAVREPVL